MSNTDKSLKLTISEMLFYIAYIILLTVKGLGFYEGQWPFNVAIVLFVILIGVKLVWSKKTCVEWIIIGTLCFLAWMIYIHSNEIGIIMIIGLIVGMKNIPIKRVMTLGGIVFGLAFFLKTLISLLGFQKDIFKVQNKLGLGYIIRWSLGQTHPNVLQISCIILCAYILYSVRLKGKRLIELTILLAAINIYFFIYSISYTGIILAFVLLIVNLYMSINKDKVFSVYEKIIAYGLVPACALFSVLGPIYFQGKLWEICNKLLNTRFNIARQYMLLNPVSLFGTGYCNELPKNFNNLDSSYVFVLMHYGIIFFLLMLLALIVLLKNLINQNKRIEVGIVLSLSVAAISEPFFANSSFKNIVWIFIGNCMFQIFNTTGNNEYSIVINYTILVELKRKIQSIIVRFGKKILYISIIGATIISIIYGLNLKMPSAYYMNRDNVQTSGEHGFLVDLNQLPDDFDGEFLEYTSEDTLMFMVSGNAIMIETIRSIVSILLWSMIGISVFMIIFYYLRSNGKHRKVID